MEPTKQPFSKWSSLFFVLTAFLLSVIVGFTHELTLFGLCFAGVASLFFHGERSVKNTTAHKMDVASMYVLMIGLLDWLLPGLPDYAVPVVMTSACVRILKQDEGDDVLFIAILALAALGILYLKVEVWHWVLVASFTVLGTIFNILSGRRSDERTRAEDLDHALWHAFISAAIFFTGLLTTI